MKIARLDLLAYGRFTDLSLDMDQGHNLHLIYGANEAGKSTSLRAMLCLLFGFGRRASDDFLHGKGDLRVGGLLRDADGAEHACIRRRGNKNTLRMLDDTNVFDEAPLKKMLQGVDRSEFSQRFGIDYEELGRGGRAIFEGGGELGKTLFAAAAGFGDLGRVQQQLQTDAEDMFTPMAQVRPINKTLSEFKTAKDQVRQALLSRGAWEKREQALQDAIAQKQSLEATRRTVESEIARLERITNALPAIAKRKAIVSDLAPLQDTPRLRADFATVRSAAQMQLAHARQDEQAAQEKLAELSEQAKQIHPQEALLALAEDIEQLQSHRGALSKAEFDKQGLSDQHAAALTEAKELLRQCGGRSASLSESEELKLGRIEVSRIRELANQSEKVHHQKEATEKRVADLKRSITAVEASLKNLPPHVDVEGLKRVCRRVEKHGDMEARLRQGRGELDMAEKEVQASLNKLSLWSGSLAELEQLSPPNLETVELHETAWAELATDRRRREDRLTELLSEEEQHAVRHAAAMQQGAPTEQDLLVARRWRDHGWRLMRDGWFQGGATEEEIQSFKEQFGPASTLEQAYENALSAADETADRLRREADQVAAKTQLLAEQAKREQRRQRLEEEIAAIEQQQTNAHEKWQALWAPLELLPLSPAEMRRWLQRYSALVTEATAVRRSQAEVAELDQLTTHCREELKEALVAASLEHAESASLDQLLAIAQSAIDTAQHADQDRQGYNREHQLHQTDLQAAEEAALAAKESLAAWRKKWSAQMQRLELSADASAHEANAVVDLRTELFARLKEAGEFETRIAGIEADAEHFATEVARLTAAAAPDLIDAAPLEAADELRGRWRRADADRSTLQTLQLRCEELSHQQENAATKAAKEEHVLKALCAEAQTEDIAALAAIEKKAETRDSLEQRLQEQSDRILLFSAGADLESFIAEALETDADQAPGELRRLQSVLEETTEAINQTAETIGAEKTERERMSQGAGAASAEEDVQQLAAKLREDSEQYARLRLGSELLQAAIERYREQHQDPVLARASDLFAELTLQSFTGLRPDMEDGDTVLLGVRPGGKRTVPISGMSAGVCDQLYLALRIASLEHYLDKHPPLPFIVDDILLTFDDERAIAALQILAQLAKRTQVIFFTHHRHLIELAEASLPADAAQTHRLEQSSPAQVGT